MKNERYFVGVALPDELSIRAASLQQDLYETHNLRRSLIPHITLLDPNLVQGIDRESLFDQIREAAPNINPPEIQLDTLEVFAGRVLCIRVECSALTDIRKLLLQLLPPEKQRLSIERDFVPHVTVGRSRRGERLSEAAISSSMEHYDEFKADSFLGKDLGFFVRHQEGAYTIADTVTLGLIT